MDHRFDKIDDKLDKILDKIEGHHGRISSVESHQKGFATILGALWVAIIGYIGNKFA